MKKVFSAALVVAIMMTCVCAGALALEANDVVGDWYFNVLEQAGIAYNPTALGMDMILTFKEEGIAFQDEDEDEEGTWSIEGDTLTVAFEDEDGDMDTLVFVFVDGNLVTDMGEDGILTFGRELIIEQTHADSPVIAATDIAEFDGEWTGDLVEMYGTKLPMSLEMTGMEMSLSIQNGEISVLRTIEGMEPQESIIQGVLEEGAIVTEYAQYAESQKTVVNLREDGSLSFMIGEDDIVGYYFVKAE